MITYVPNIYYPDVYWPINYWPELLESSSSSSSSTEHVAPTVSGIECKVLRDRPHYRGSNRPHFRATRRPHFRVHQWQ